MIRQPADIVEGRPDVLGLQIRQLDQDLFGREAVREQVEDIRDPDPHPADARPPAALLGTDRDACEEIVRVHAVTLALRGPSQGATGPAVAGAGRIASFRP